MSRMENLPIQILSSVDLARPFLDERLPARDVLGHLADKSIRRNELESLGDYVRANWPTVQVIACGVSQEAFRFAIHIFPFSVEEQVRHWTLADWIANTFDCRDASYVFLPPYERLAHSAELVIYVGQMSHTGK